MLSGSGVIMDPQNGFVVTHASLVSPFLKHDPVSAVLRNLLNRKNTNQTVRIALADPEVTCERYHLADSAGCRCHWSHRCIAFLLVCLLFEVLNLCG